MQQIDQNFYCQQPDQFFSKLIRKVKEICQEIKSISLKSNILKNQINISMVSNNQPDIEFKFQSLQKLEGQTLNLTQSTSSILKQALMLNKLDKITSTKKVQDNDGTVITNSLNMPHIDPSGYTYKNLFCQQSTNYYYPTSNQNLNNNLYPLTNINPYKIEEGQEIYNNNINYNNQDQQETIYSGHQLNGPESYTLPENHQTQIKDNDIKYRISQFSNQDIDNKESEDNNQNNSSTNQQQETKKKRGRPRKSEDEKKLIKEDRKKYQKLSYLIQKIDKLQKNVINMQPGNIDKSLLKIQETKNKIQKLQQQQFTNQINDLDNMDILRKKVKIEF